MLSDLWTDIRYCLRTFRRSPGFAAAAIIPIAFGVGINTGIFSIVDSIALQPLPAPRAHELVSIYQQLQGVPDRDSDGTDSMFSLPEYRTYRDGARTLSGVMAYSRPWRVTLGGESPQEVSGTLVTCNYFDVLEVRPMLGGGFTSHNCKAQGGPPVVVLSHQLWTSVFGADPDIARKTVTLNRRNFAVVGVAPESFEGVDFSPVTFFVSVDAPASLGPNADFYRNPNTSWLSFVGRRRHDVEVSQVRAELGTLARQIDQQQPGRTTRLIVADATGLSVPEGRRNVLRMAGVVLMAFGLVLVIACANVANLLLARAADRAKEIAVRLSVGASRRRLVQQLLTESAIIALAGGAIGTLLAAWSFQGLPALVLSSIPGSLPLLRSEPYPSAGVFLFAFALTMVTAVLFGMAPALQASRPDVQTALKQDSAGAGRRSGVWLRSLLVGVQVVVCTVLLVSAALLGRGLYSVLTLEPGFEYEKVAVVSLDLRASGYDAARSAAFHRQVIGRIGALPGVEGLAQAAAAPLSPENRRSTFRVPGQPSHQINLNEVSPTYFSVVAIPILRGRTFTEQELTDASRVVIVSQATARRFWPGSDPIGQTFIRLHEKKEIPLTVIGVAQDAHVVSLGTAEPSYVYLPVTPRVQNQLRLMVRSQLPFASLASSVRAAAHGLDPNLLVRVNRLEENLDTWRTLSRMVASLAGSLSLLALVLASIGVYGVVSYVVSRRLREVGIRMMLGATIRDVYALILRQTLRPVAVGVTLGIVLAAAAAQVLRAVLFGISPLDPIAFIGASVFLLTIATLAGFIPLRRAMNADPVTTLRYE